MMITDKLTTEDVLNFMSGKLVVKLPDYLSCNSAKTTLSYVRNAYKDRFKDGMVLTGTIDSKNNTMTVEYIHESELLQPKD